MFTLLRTVRLFHEIIKMSEIKTKLRKPYFDQILSEKFYTKSLETRRVFLSFLESWFYYKENLNEHKVYFVLLDNY